ncbi:MAG: squalene/phytoene synthase family protein [Geminicoccaceae bacterium]|nr:squalene/phytoene synthase family protein [Geminicoccaceae bacterium]
MTELSPVASILRAHDRDRFQTALFARPPARDALIALYAFDCEIGRVRHVVSQPMAGLIRLQWWRDALDGIAGGQPPGQPVARAMQASWPLLGPHRALLETALEAREVELDPAPFSTIADLDRHLAATSGGIGRVAALVLSPEPMAEAAAQVHCAWGMVQLLADLEADRRQDRSLVPSGLLRAAGVDVDRLAEVDDPQALREPVRQLVDLARKHLDAARHQRPRGGVALPALLLAKPASKALRRLAKSGYDHRSPWRRTSPFAPLGLLLNHVRGRY